MASSVSGQDESNPALIGYPSGQDGATLPARECPPCPARKIFPKANMFMDLDSVSVHKHAKKELGQYPAILTSHLVNNPYLLLTQQARSVFYHCVKSWSGFEGSKWMLLLSEVENERNRSLLHSVVRKTLAKNDCCVVVRDSTTQSQEMAELSHTTAYM